MDHETLNSKRTQELLKFIYSIANSQNIKVGFNEAVKAVKNNAALLVVIATDAEPKCLIEPLPVLCEQKGVQYVCIDSKTALGKACAKDIDALACAIVVPKHEDSTKLSTEIAKVLK